MRGTRLALIVAAGLLAGPGRALSGQASDEADRVVQQIRRETKDIRQVPAKILQAAKMLDKGTSLQIALYEKAYEHGLRMPSGHDAAVGAMEALLEIAPDRKEQWQQKLLRALELGYLRARGPDKQRIGKRALDLLLVLGDGHLERGEATKAAVLYRRATSMATALRSRRADEAKIKLKTANAARMIDRQTRTFKALLKQDPKDARAREGLIRVYVVELDTPAEANALLTETVPEAWRTYVPLAMKDPAELPEAAVLEIAEWYSGHAERATPVGRPRMLRRVRAYCRRFLETHTQQDAAYLAAKRLLERTDEALLALGEPKPEWIDLLKRVAPSRHAVEGQWTKGRDGLRVALRADCRIAIPVIPKGSYELEVWLTREEGSEAVLILLPAGEGHAAIVLGGWKGQVSGLQCVGGKPANENETAVRPGPLPNGKRHKVEAKVHLRDRRHAEIRVRLDGKPLISWKGKQSALSPHKGWGIPDLRTLGLGADRSRTTFHSARLRMLSGKAVLPRQ